MTALFLLGMVASTHAGTHTIEGRVVGVSDGDTITMLDAENAQHKIRLDGVDAPELKQPFGSASKRHLSGLAFNRDAVAVCGKTDRYRREVCQVLVGGVDIGLIQLQAGLAWYFRRYAKELPPDRRQQYADMEAQAQAERRGLWADAGPVAPWDWRRPERAHGTGRDTHHAAETEEERLGPLLGYVALHRPGSPPLVRRLGEGLGVRLFNWPLDDSKDPNDNKVDKRYQEQK